jgi:hypothetical protein
VGPSPHLTEELAVTDPILAAAGESRTPGWTVASDDAAGTGVGA